MRMRRIGIKRRAPDGRTYGGSRSIQIDVSCTSAETKQAPIEKQLSFFNRGGEFHGQVPFNAWEGELTSSKDCRWSDCCPRPTGARRTDRASSPRRPVVASHHLWTVEELDPIRSMTAEQAATLKRLAEAAYELDAFKPNLTRAEANLRIAMLTAKLKLLSEPPHTL
jgi:hypothetical protein